MPPQRCNIEGRPGWKWGESGKCYPYTPGDEKSEGEAKRKAYIQGYAIGELTEMEQQEIWGNNLSELANILNVPIITEGVFQGHKGPPVVVNTEKFQKMLKGSTRFQPYLKQALETGELPGNPDFFERLQKPMPAPITFNHEVLENDKIRDALKNIHVEFSEELIPDEQHPDGKPWIVERFSGVDPVVADIIRRFFTKRSAEILELNDPETGERLPVIISTAFLSNKEIRPAVPGQSDDILVEFSDWNESHYVINIDQPLTQGVKTMADKKEEKSVDVSELQKNQETLTAQIAELQSKLEASEAEKKKVEEEKAKAEKAKKNAEKEVTELQAIQTQLTELQAQNEELVNDKLINHLNRYRKKDGKTFQISPAYKDLVEPIVRGNGVIELAEGQTYRQAIAKVFDEIAETPVLIQLSLEGEIPHDRNDDKPKNFDDEVHELMEAENLEIGEAIERVTVKHRNGKKEE